jgi:hypothetical protein
MHKNTNLQQYIYKNSNICRLKGKDVVETLNHIEIYFLRKVMLGQSRSKFVDFVTNSRHISIEYFSMVYSWELGIKSQAEHDLFVCYLDLHFF